VSVTNPVRIARRIIPFRDARRLVERGRAEWSTLSSVIRMIETHPEYQEALKARIATVLQLESDAALASRRVKENEPRHFRAL
jgi:hypothetical protein